jgi:hypothetical protein
MFLRSNPAKGCLTQYAIDRFEFVPRRLVSAVLESSLDVEPEENASGLRM